MTIKQFVAEFHELAASPRRIDRWLVATYVLVGLSVALFAVWIVVTIWTLWSQS